MTNYYQAADNLKQYYRLHSLFYDITRWSFLFGRKKIITHYLPDNIPAERILEVGCGTGKNLQLLQRNFRDVAITGVDLSGEMLQKAQKKIDSNQVHLEETYYESSSFDDQSFDLILFSYSLSMMNPGWKQAIANAYDHLNNGGLIAVVDFFESDINWFKKWMLVNHVRMDSHLLPELNKYFEPIDSTIKTAYLGVWKYLLFVGKKQ
ncbi:MAG TPA: class I SAM-dependent methyltransferase [Balneolales bacterium]|nr:class I SAM-dependent methyltransferase [Balneolales bacterium]